MSCSSKFSEVLSFHFLAFSQHQGKNNNNHTFSQQSSDWGWEMAGLFLVHFSVWRYCSLGCRLWSLYLGGPWGLPPIPWRCENRSSSGSINDFSDSTEIIFFLWGSLMALWWWFSYHLDKLLSIEGRLTQVPTLEIEVLYLFLKPKWSGLLTSEVRENVTKNEKMYVTCGLTIHVTTNRTEKNLILCK